MHTHTLTMNRIHSVSMSTGKDQLTHTSDRLWRLESEQRWEILRSWRKCGKLNQLWLRCHLGWNQNIVV